MAGTGPSRRSRSDKPGPSLSEQAHQQTLDYLEQAEKSSHADIRAVALDIAKEINKYYRRQAARVSPTLILLVNIALGIVVGLACWYALLHYQTRLAYELAGVSILLYLILVGVSLFLPGYLSQANFMKILGWMVSHIKNWGKSEGTK